MEKREIRLTREIVANQLIHNCRECSHMGPRATAIRCSTESCAMHATMKNRFRGNIGELLLVARQYCTQCMGGQQKLVRNCGSISCKLWPIRDIEALIEEKIEALNEGEAQDG